MVKIKDLSDDDGSLPDLDEGSQILADIKGKTYPVTFVSFAGTYNHLATIRCLHVIVVYHGTLTRRPSKQKRENRRYQG